MILKRIEAASASQKNIQLPVIDIKEFQLRGLLLIIKVVSNFYIFQFQIANE